MEIEKRGAVSAQGLGPRPIGRGVSPASGGAWVLRLAIAFAFIYPAVSAYLDPFSWIGFFPPFMKNLVGSETLLLTLFGLSEIAIALWILTARRVFIPALIASVYLLAIVLFNLASLDIVFRDVSILLAALALALLDRPPH